MGGRLSPISEAHVGADDSAYAEGRGCFTTLRIADGAPRFAARHLRRLCRDARALGLPAPDTGALGRGLSELARAAFGTGDGIVRLQLSRDGEGALCAVGRARSLAADTDVWRAITAREAHPGPSGGHKVSARRVWAEAEAAARDAGADEALLFDRAGRLVEGARSNLVVLDTAGTLCTPPLERGAVAGIALEVLRERLTGLRHRDFSQRGLFAARGVAAINSVRGARALASLDGRALGSEGASLAERLEAALAGAA